VVRLRQILGLRSKSKKNAKLIATIHRTGLCDAAYYLALLQTGLTPPSILPGRVERRGASLAHGSTQCFTLSRTPM
jgi:hypothetical protein